MFLAPHLTVCLRDPVRAAYASFGGVGVSGATPDGVSAGRLHPGRSLPASISPYDRETQLPLSGDIVYPGHLFIFAQSHWNDFKGSLERMIRFARVNPVEWVVGCHIEMSSVPLQSYAWGTPAHPDEHVLQLAPSEMVEILEAAEAMGNNPQCTIFDEFVIHPVYKCGITWNG